MTEPVQDARRQAEGLVDGEIVMLVDGEPPEGDYIEQRLQRLKLSLGGVFEHLARRLAEESRPADGLYAAAVELTGEIRPLGATDLQARLYPAAGSAAS